jgi:hypothetical protein
LLAAATATKLVQGPVALVETCFNTRIAGEAALTVSVSEAVLPVPPFVEETAPLVLAKLPVLGAVTVVVTLQEEPAPIDAPLKLMLLTPAVAVNVPPQVLIVPTGVVLTTVPGYVSEKATPVSALFWFGFVRVKVSVEVPLARIGFGANSFVMLGGCRTVSDAAALPVEPVFVPPLVEAIKPLTF